MTSKTILVIEDDRSVRLFLSINLQARGYEVLVTGNIATAWSDIERFKPDMMILDLFLDDGFGTDLVKRLSQEKNDIPIVVTTGATDEHLKDLTYPNVISVIHKPYDLGQLLAAIEP